MNEGQRQDTQLTYQERILRVLIHIQHDLDADLALEDLASIAHHLSAWESRLPPGLADDVGCSWRRRREGR